MTWTSEKPTVEGWYWYRDDLGARVILVMDDVKGLFAVDVFTGESLPLDGLSDQFAGPIPKPEKPK
jgi:hypothetical protein